jgi:hypothetical protein
MIDIVSEDAVTAGWQRNAKVNTLFLPVDARVIRHCVAAEHVSDDEPEPGIEVLVVHIAVTGRNRIACLATAVVHRCAADRIRADDMRAFFFRNRCKALGALFGQAAASAEHDKAGDSRIKASAHER